MNPLSGNILALDRGKKYIGIAYYNTRSKMTMPIGSLENDPGFLFNLGSLLEQHKITKIVIGYPKQHELTQKLIDLLIAQIKAINSRIETVKVDEEYSTVLAQAQLGSFDRDSIDDTVAAMHILDYYLMTQESKKKG